VDIPDGTAEAVGCVDVAKGRVFPTRYKERKVVLAGCYHPTHFRVDLVMGGKLPISDQTIKKLVREVSLIFLVSLAPFIQDRPFNSPDGFLFGDAGISHPIEMTLQELLLMIGGEFTIVGNTEVVIMSH
jgi:hypothetical protein